MEHVLKKLGCKEPARVLLMNAPPAIDGAIAAQLTVPVDRAVTGGYDFAMVFVQTLAEYLPLRADLVSAMAPQGRLWICYPKKTSRNFDSDLSRDILWPTLGEFNYEPVSQFAVDADWSAMRFRPVAEIRSLKRKIAGSDEARARLEKEQS